MQSAGLGRLATQDGFSIMERSSEKNSDLRSRAKFEGEDSGVKGQDERQSSAPLTPESSPPDIPGCFPENSQKKSIDNADAVIHGATFLSQFTDKFLEAAELAELVGTAATLLTPQRTLCSVPCRIDLSLRG